MDQYPGVARSINSDVENLGTVVIEVENNRTVIVPDLERLENQVADILGGA